MEYRILGRTGIEVSIIGFGGEGFENKSYDECKNMIDAGMEKGINFFDVYNSNPDVRSNLGNILSKYPRNSFVIEGHLCTTWDDEQYRRTRDIDEVIDSYEDFLNRMKLDYVDIGMIHYVDEDKDFDEIFNGKIIKYAKKLKKKGIIRALGISTHNTDIAFRSVETGLVDVILFSIKPAYDMIPADDDVNILFEESTFEDRIYEGVDLKRSDLYHTCESEGVALTSMKGYAAGILLSDEQSPFKKKLTPIQCIHYCLTRPAVSAVMVGVSDEKQIFAAAEYSSSDDLQKDYSEVLANAPKTSFSGHCMYCGHCAPCSSHIDIALVNKYLDLSLIQKNVPETLKNHYDLLKHHASDCIECGHCMANCPFDVDIIGKMKQAVMLFEK